MLPAFPKAQKILDETWNERMFFWKNRVFPLHLHPPVYPIIEGKTSDFQREDRKVKPLKMKKHSVKTSHKIEDGKGMTLQIFEEKAKEVGEGVGKQLFQAMVGVVEEAVQETGNEVKIKKGELKQEDIFRIYESTQHNFDEKGNPTGQFVCGSEFMEELRKHEKAWNEDEDFVAKLDEIKKRKKMEFDEREACRRLVD
jgi:hypothetical protein